MKFSFAKHEKVFKKEDYTLYPRLYWKMILLFCGFGLVAVFVFGGITFIKINKNTEILPIDTSLEAKDLNINRLTEILKYFKSKEQQSAEILISGVPVVDPSR